EVYVESMFPLNHGYPLWLPQPDRNLPLEYRLKGVSIGDVGFITHSGAFDFLFNIWAPGYNLSDSLCSVSPPKFATSFRESLPPRSTISRISDIEWEMNASTIESSGAILFMPCGASEEDFINERALKSYISKSAECWYRYALKQGRDIDRHALYLVTGCMKSNSWGTATFNSVESKHQRTLII
ncbi:hypothetical protein BDQ17DRAFT_1211804, partial [Cyathus striatus]